jgi:LacI family transcriptional regulator, galactose operon repressor
MNRPSGAHARSRRPAGIKDIAKALGVSTGTVDRALHARPGINEATSRRVLKMAEKMGYRPNLAARYLKSGRQLVISVQLPVEIAYFFDSLRAGICDAAGPFAQTVHIETDSYPRLGEADEPPFHRALDNQVDGIVICPADPVRMKPWIEQAAEAGIPVVCVATDAPHTRRLTAVSADPFAGGAIAGELLSLAIHGPGDVAIITGDLSTVDHAEKLRGFRSMIKTLGSGLTLATVAEAHDEEREAYRQTREILKLNPALKGIYVSTANSLPVVEALVDLGRAGQVPLITTDLFVEMVPLIRSGKIAASIYQRPRTQGRLAFFALYQYIIEGIRPSPAIRLAPQIVMRSNVDLLLERTRLEPEEEAWRPSAAHGDRPFA